MFLDTELVFGFFNLIHRKEASLNMKNANVHC